MSNDKANPGNANFEDEIYLDETAHELNIPAEAQRKLAEMKSGTSASRRGRKPSPEKRLQILEAAVKLFTSRDYHEVLMDHVAEQAGVGKGTVYRYFPTKEALFRELVTLAVERVTALIRVSGTNTGPALARLRRSVAMTVEFFRKNDSFLQILYHDKTFRCCRERKDLDRKRKELRGFFARLLAKGIAEGSVRSDMEPAVGAIMIMASISALMRNFGNSRTSDQIADQMLTILLDGMISKRGKRAAIERRETPAQDLLDDNTKAQLDPLASLRELGGIPGHSPTPSHTSTSGLDNEPRVDFGPST